MEQQPLKKEIIKIKAINLVEKSRNDGSTWKEYEIEVEDYVKGEHYSVPIKKRDGAFTAAYSTLKKMKSEWEEEIIANGYIEVGVAVSVKESKWEHEGKSGTSYYKTIRFFGDASEMRNQMSKEELAESTKKEESEPEEEFDINEIPFD